MKNDYIIFNVFKDKGLLKGLILSLLTHFFLFTFIPIKEDKFLGDKFVPLEIIDFKYPIIKDDSINESEKTITKNLPKTEINSKKKSEEKLEKKMDEKIFENLKKETKNNKVEKSSFKKTTSQKRQFEKDDKGYQKVNCLNCIQPKYPKLARKRGYLGVLKLELLILKSGIVKEVFIKKSTGFEILDKSGVNAAFKSKFYPLTKETKQIMKYIF